MTMTAVAVQATELTSEQGIVTVRRRYKRGEGLTLWLRLVVLDGVGGRLGQWARCRWSCWIGGGSCVEKR